MTPASIVTKCSFKKPERGNNFPKNPVGIALLNSNEIVPTEFCKKVLVSAANKSYQQNPESLDMVLLQIHFLNSILLLFL